MSESILEVHHGMASAQGPRASNDDFALVRQATDAGRTLIAALADGVSGAGGRMAAEVVVRGFVEGFLCQPETQPVERAAARALTAMNRWLHAQGRHQSQHAGHATTFTAALLRGRRLHCVHVGDTRLYRLRDGILTCLTRDHTHSHPDLQHVLIRAVGMEPSVVADYTAVDLQIHDRYLLCCDGIYSVLDQTRLQQQLANRDAPEQTASRIVAAALQRGSQDNCSAVVLDVLSLPAADRLDLQATFADLPIVDLPAMGETVDEFRLLAVLADGRYSRVFRAEDLRGGATVVIKFPHPRVASDASYRRAFLREAWIASQVRSTHVGEVLPLEPGRRSCLYSVLAYYPGETLEQRLLREPAIGLQEGVRIAVALAKAVYALHKRNIIHRDVKPDNVLLAADGPRLVDLGVARIPGLDGDDGDIPGTPSYMAPEMFNGNAGDVQTDVYALGVTLYRIWSRRYPFGEIEAFSRPRFERRVPLTHYRPDLPAWVDALLTRATATQPGARHGDTMELAIELEQNLLRNPPPQRNLPLYQRNPLRFWQAISLLLLLALLAALFLR